MREIKFRAWDKKKQKWLLGYEFENLGGFSMLGEVQMMGAYAALLASYFPDRIDDINLMQFTGLNDEENKEIYENDIVEWKDYYQQVRRDYVVWNEEYSWWALSRDTGNALGTRKVKNSAPIRIIGNIHENPELLKEVVFDGEHSEERYCCTVNSIEGGHSIDCPIDREKSICNCLAKPPCTHT